MTEEQLDIKIGGQLDQSSITRVIGAVAPIFALKEPKVVVIDMSTATFCTPAPLAIVRAATEYLVRSKLFVRGGSGLISPDDASVRQYVRRMDVFAGIVNYSDAETFRRHDPVRFAPFTSFDNEDGATEAAIGLVRSIGAGGIPDVAKARLKGALIELTENVTLHSGSSGVAGAQAWPATHWIELAVADCGLGIVETLQRNPAYADLSRPDALRKALEVHVTGRREDPGRGQGLWVISKTVERNNGQMWLVCDDLMLKQSGGDISVTTLDAGWTGTLAVVRLHAQRTMDIADLLEMYFPADNDYEFVEFE